MPEPKEKITEFSILMGSIIAILIAGIVGVIGMLAMYSIFPVMILAEPTCICEGLHEDYEQTRNLFAIIGFFFGFIPIGIWQLFVNLKLKGELENEPLIDGVEK